VTGSVELGAAGELSARSVDEDLIAPGRLERVALAVGGCRRRGGSSLPGRQVRGLPSAVGWAGSETFHSWTLPAAPAEPLPSLPLARTRPSGLNATEQNPAGPVPAVMYRHWPGGAGRVGDIPQADVARAVEEAGAGEGGARIAAVAAGGQGVTVGAERHRAYRMGDGQLRAQGGGPGRVGDTPQPDLPGVVAAGQDPPVRAERHRGEPVRIRAESRQGGWAGRVGDTPHLDDAGQVAAGQDVPARAERQRAEPLRVGA
jgi:hypothetical protein